MLKEDARKEERKIGNKKKNGRKGVMNEDITRIMLPERPNLRIS
jgi:hypothetical protein